MRRADVAPTKSNLLRLKEHFAFVRAGHELLDQKREVLLEELVDVHREAAQLRREVERTVAAVYEALRQALLAGGRPELEAEALCPAGEVELRVRERSIMGVVVPLIDLAVGAAPEPAAAPGWAPPATATVRLGVRRLLAQLARLGETEVSCLRLAVELQKTQRKVNALEHVFIPEYRDTIRFIEATLEEREREALFHLKRLKGGRDEDAEEG
jgi:V/A-type H+/Na+-transporting ATPase subunit D